MSRIPESEPFVPVLWLRGRHVETIVPALFPAPPVRGPRESRIVSVAPDAAVRLEVSQPSGAPRGTLLLVHGMGGSAESGYMRRTASAALERGWIAVRMNCRNCGGTEALSRTLYNAGQSDDIGAVLRDLDAAGFPRPFGAIGFSLGGNLVLRYAGTAGANCLASAVVGVNPPVDLGACCRALEKPENRFYHLYFTLGLCRTLRRIRRTRPVSGPEPTFRKIRTLRRFDAAFTAPDAGYPSAEAYYQGASAAPALDGIHVPALIISAGNDPFVPEEIFTPHRREVEGLLRFLHPSRGGHLGYWGAPSPRFWAAKEAIAFAERETRPSVRKPRPPSPPLPSEPR